MPICASVSTYIILDRCVTCIHYNLYHSCDSFSMFSVVSVCSLQNLSVAFSRPISHTYNYGWHMYHHANVVVSLFRVINEIRQAAEWLPEQVQVCKNFASFIRDARCCCCRYSSSSSSCCRSLFGPSPRCFSLLLFFVVFSCFLYLVRRLVFCPFLVLTAQRSSFFWKANQSYFAFNTYNRIWFWLFEKRSSHCDKNRK